MAICIIFLATFLILNNLCCVLSESIPIIIVMDERDTELLSHAEKAINSSGIVAEYFLYKEGKEDEARANISEIIEKGMKCLVDMTWPRESIVKSVAEMKNIPFVKLTPTNWQFYRATDNYIESMQGADVALIYDSEKALDQALNEIIGNTCLRIIVLHGLDEDSTRNLKKMRPNPSNFAIFGRENSISDIMEKAMESKLMTRDSRWIFVLEDFGGLTLSSNFKTPVTIIKPDETFCCELVMKTECTCKEINLKATLISYGLKKLSAALKSSLKDGIANQTEFNKNLEEEVSTHKRLMYNETIGIYLNMNLDVVRDQDSKSTAVGKWETTIGYKKDPDVKINDTLRRHLVVGTVKSEPFAFPSGKFDSDGNPIYTGYCIDLLERIATEMKFSYTIKFPDDGKYGVKFTNGTWNGVIGELMLGEIDMIVAGLSMTSEREEVVDFVSPYFDQAGISIVMRRKLPSDSLFKFLQVLNWRVWLSMVAAIFVTGLVLWIVDKTSPYSAQNNPDKYPNSRIFNIKESFWFALTSFTPQGGGETPKSVSARCLVAAYWLFVVLMLATFTANLAAFLTVERMKTPIQSLEELSRQSAVKYSVVESTSIHQYFKSMKLAEEELYKMWKDATLKQSISESKFRVWDYPIHERYGDLLEEIENNDPMPNDSIGMQRVREGYMDKEFALVHDSNKVRYEVYRNCNLTEVGRAFAEQPYAIAVRTGSPLRHKISEVVLKLQKNRYLEILNKKYWNPTMRRNCRKVEQSEGITLHNVGGIFIGVAVGITLAFIILIGERYFGWCQGDQKRSMSAVQPISIKPAIMDTGEKEIKAGLDPKYLPTVNF